MSSLSEIVNEKAIKRLESLIELVEATRKSSTGMTLIIHELKKILELLKGNDND